MRETSPYNHKENHSLPTLSEPEIIAYLSSQLFHGIGRRTAEVLVEHFGTETLQILEESPSLLHQIPSLQSYRIAKINAAWTLSQQDPLRSAFALLLGLGVSFALTLKICDYYGHHTEAILLSNPYRLADDLSGVGFKTADEIALGLGSTPDGEKRYTQALIYVLKEARKEGHCFLPSEILLERTLTKLVLPHYQPSRSRLQRVLSIALAEGVLAEGELSESIYLPSSLATETRVACNLQQRRNQPPTDDEPLKNWLVQWSKDSWREFSLLSTEQTEALLMASSHYLSILTGGPGRGKTYALKIFVEWLSKTGKSFALAAPTGKAARKMETTTDHEAKTIHRLLQWQGTQGNFTYNANNQLPLDWLIIDEFSMVDIFLFNSLLKALKPQTKLLLVGDKDQLPSVGPGMVLRDLLLAEIFPTTQLQKIFRQKENSPILYAAEDVNQGRVPEIQEFQQVLDWQNMPDCALLERNNPALTATGITELVRAIKKSNLDLNFDLVVLAPQKKGTAGVHHLNQLLQPIFNPHKPSLEELVVGEVIYRVGDRVIQQKNRYDTDPAVMNGETGFVVAVDKEKFTIEVYFEEGARVTYNRGVMDEITHSFCLTCHKAQGSEFPYVIMPLLTSHQRMLTRQLLYTTMTRASGVFLAVGQPQALRGAVSNDRPARRYTQLHTQLSYPFDELQGKLDLLLSKHALERSSVASVTVNRRLGERGLTATKGQMTQIGSLALQLHVDKYGYRPSKQYEQVGKFRFKTYHYSEEAAELLDRAINLVKNITQSA